MNIDLSLISSILIIIIIELVVIHAQQDDREVLLLEPTPSNSLPSDTLSPYQCTKDPTEEYAVCASGSLTALKFNLQPFSFAIKGPHAGNVLASCDLFYSTSQERSRAICSKSVSTVLFYRVNDMTLNATVTVGATGIYFQVVVDQINQVAFVSNHHSVSPAIFRIINIGSNAPSYSGYVSPFGVGDASPSGMIIADGWLFAHMSTYPARLARFSINPSTTTFAYNQTVKFLVGENSGYFDNLVTDENNFFIYDLVALGTIVRITHRPVFSRLDSLVTGFGPATNSLAIAPDAAFLLIASDSSGIIVVNTSSFKVESRRLLSNPVSSSSSSFISASGRPIILRPKVNNNNEKFYPVCAFSNDNDKLYTFNAVRRRLSESQEYSMISPLIFSPSGSNIITTFSDVKGSRQCTTHATLPVAVCASASAIAIKYNLAPFSYAVKGLKQGNHQPSCDLYDGTNEEVTSLALCIRGSTPAQPGVVFFYRVSDMVNITNVTVGLTASLAHIIIDKKNRNAYVSNYRLASQSPSIYKVTNIVSSSPLFVATLASLGPGDSQPAAMLIVDDSLLVHMDIAVSARLTRIDISSSSSPNSFMWRQTVNFTDLVPSTAAGSMDNLVNDKNNFIYDLMLNGIIVRCRLLKTENGSNFLELYDFLSTRLAATYSLSISPDTRTLFVLSYANSLLQMVDVKSFKLFGNSTVVPSGMGRPIALNNQLYAFSSLMDSVFAFRYGNPTNTRSHSTDRSISSSTERSDSLLNSSSISQEASPSEINSFATTSRTADSSSSSASSSSTSSSSQRTHDTSSSQSAATVSETRIMPPPPYLSQRRNIYQTTTTVSSLLSIVSMSSVGVLSSIKFRSVVKHFNAILYGNCGLTEESLSEMENESADISSSPTRLKLFGNAMTGLVIGNILLIVGIGVVWFVGHQSFHRGGTPDEKRQQRKRNISRSRREKQQTNDQQSFLEKFAASKAHFMMLWTAMLVLEPTLTYGATALIGGFVVAGREVTILSTLCAILAWFVLLICGLMWTFWSLVIRRDSRDDFFDDEFNDDENENETKRKLPHRIFVEFMTNPSGEWNFIGMDNNNNNKNDNKQLIRNKTNFDLALPFIEAYTPKFVRFFAVDLSIIVLLSSAEIISYLISDEHSGNSASCFARGVIVCIAIGLHISCVLYYRLLYVDRLSNNVVILGEILSIALLAGAMSLNTENIIEDNAIEDWSQLAVGQAVIGAICTLVEVVAFSLPIYDWIVKKMSQGERKKFLGELEERIVLRDENDEEELLPIISNNEKTVKSKKVTKRRLITKKSKKINNIDPTAI